MAIQGFVKSLDAKSAVAVGTELGVAGRPYISWQVETSGTPDSITVSLEGRLDGSLTYRTIKEVTSTDGQILEFANTPLAMRSVRLNFTAISGGTNPKVTGWISAI